MLNFTKNSQGTFTATKLGMSFKISKTDDYEGAFGSKSQRWMIKFNGKNVTTVPTFKDAKKLCRSLLKHNA